MKLTILPSTANDELSVNAKGGTELMYQGLMERLDPSLLEKFQIIPSRVRNLDPNKKHILWLHDLPMDPEAQHLKDPESRKRFDGFVFVSNWQMQAYNWFLGVPYADSVVIPNAIVPFPNNIEKKYDGPIKLIYHTTPHRGLELLVPVFEELYEHFNGEIQLDVFSSFSIYGWHQRDEPYRALFQRCKDHPGINYHGAVPNSRVREALTEAHIFAYPSIWMETSCIAMLEAMSAGCVCVHPNLAALPETSGTNNEWMYQWNENPEKHKQIFKEKLLYAIEISQYNFNGKSLVDSRNNWEDIKYIWMDYLQSKGS